MNPLVSEQPNSGIKEQVFVDGDSFYKTLAGEIAAAQDTICLETYIFEQDQIGLQILQLLADAAGRGVRVQLLMDGVGSSFWNYAQASAWRKKGIEIRFFHPLPWQKQNSQIWSYFNLQKWRLRFSKLTQRNHSKVCIIDARVAFVGSMNISVCHSAANASAPAWRDTSVTIDGDRVYALLRKFQNEWTNYKRHFSFFKRHDLYDQLLQHISAAKNKIWLTTPYFAPNVKLIATLCQQAQKGIDVRLLFPLKCDVWGVKYAMESFYELLLDSGVRIFEYQPSVLHAKVSIIDQWITVGSTNLDHQSLFYNLEADVVISKSENIQNLQHQFLEDLKSSKEIIVKNWSQRSWLSRVREKIFKIFIAIF